MTIIAKDILQRARIQLADGTSVVWPLPDLLLYLSDGVREIALHKPNAVSKSVTMRLSEGAHQTHAFYRLIDVKRNLKSGLNDTPRVGGRAITPIDTSVLDLSMPGWQDPTVLPYRKEVDHVAQDMRNPGEFYVCPGNDGTGIVEAIVAELPAPLPRPSGSEFDIANYTQVVAIPDIYFNALTDYVLHRAYAKDTRDSSLAQRSAAHYQLFAGAIGLKKQADATTNIDAGEEGARGA